MKWKDDISLDSQEWLSFIGNFSPTVHAKNKELKGWTDGDKCYLSSSDLRYLAKACIEAADWLDLRSELEGEPNANTTK